MSKARTWAVVVALSCAGAAGCKKTADGAKGGAGAGKAAEGTASEAKVLDLYVHCFNEVDQRINDSWHGYVKWVDADTGPTGKEKAINGINEINDYHLGKCQENLKKAVEAGGSGPLVDATKAVMTALDALVPVVKETKTYYDQKNYKDDGFAKGKELHGKLVAAYGAWKQAEDALRGIWDERHRAGRDKELARLEKEHGRKSELFVSSQIMNTGEEVIEAVTAPAVNADAVRAAIAKYQAAYAEMDTFFGPGLTASTDTDRYMLKQEAEELLIQTKEAIRALDAKKALPEDGDGSQSAMLDKYNDLVERSNSITWD